MIKPSLKAWMKVLAASFVAASCLLPPALAEAAGFYENKTITMLVNYGAGGNADTSARIFQHYLERHLPGARIVVQDLPGAGGDLAFNTLGLSLGHKPDGMTIGFFGLNPPALIAGDPGLKVSLNDFNFVGAVRDWDVAFVRKDAIPGMKTPEDIVKAKRLFIGGYSRTNSNDVRSELSLQVLGVPYKLITGFPGTADVIKAMAQGEISFANSALPSYMRQAVPQIVTPGLGMPVFYFPVTGPDGKLGRVKSLDRLGIKSFPEVYRAVRGSDPSGPAFDALLLMCDLDSAMHGAIVTPKDAPAPAVQELRKAFSLLATDEDFQAAYAKAAGEKPELVNSDELRPLIARIGSTSSQIKSVFRKLTQE